LEKLPAWQVPVLLDPFLDPLTCRLELLARRAPRDARDTLPIWHPEKFASQEREAPLHAGVKTAEAAQASLLGCDRQVEFL
jgi:hypothetical protein